jgi:primosomal protein N'
LGEVLKERKIFHYPPFYDFTRLEYRDVNKEKAFLFIKRIKNKLDLCNK